MKRKKIFRIVAAWLLLSVGALRVQAAQQSERPSQQPTGEAAQIAAQVTDDRGARCWALEDGSRSTKITLTGQSLTIQGQSPFWGIYLIWDQPPGSWQAEGEGVLLSGGEEGFLHEYLPLPQSCSTLTLTAPAGAVCCDVYLLGEGATPDWVQVWQPPLEDADLLLLPTHADDEHLYFGGTMPYYAGELGKKVQVVYFTNHWAEPYRPHELLDGLWTVGIRAYPVISEFVDRYADTIEQARALYDEEEAVAFQVEQLRRFRPEVVVGHDLNGEYGHGVHKYNAYILQRALEAAADASQYPESAARYGTWDVPKTYLHLYPENPILMDWSQPLAHFGGKTALEMAQLGFAEHQSQQTYFKVEDFGPYDCRRFGLYRTRVGADVIGGDFFENLEQEDYSDYQPPAPTPQPAVETPMPESSSVSPSAAQGEQGESLPVLWLAPLGVCGVLLAGLGVWFRRRRR